MADLYMLHERIFSLMLWRMSFVLWFLNMAVTAQTQKASLDQCNADVALLRSAPVNSKHLSIGTLNSLGNELISCGMDYPNASERPTWVKLDHDIWTEIAMRQLHFLDRHKLINQFIEEDEKGER